MMAATVMAFDFGLKRIGVAVGDLELGIAHPVTTLNVATNVERLTAVEKLVAEWQPIQFVIGEAQYEDTVNNEAHPVAHPIAHLAKKFGNRLTEQYHLPITYVNEFLSSTEAASQLKEQGITGRAQKTQLDAMAAQIILQAFFDEQQTQKNMKARDAA
jgi:putative holliday junction resolvase